MKRLALVALTSVAVVVTSYAQGTVNFNNRVTGVGGVVAPIYGVDGVTGLAGDAYTAQLFGGPEGTAVDSLTPLTPVTVFRTGAAAGFVVSGNVVSVTGVAGGATATLQLRAWDNQGGTLTEFDAAQAAGAAWGASTPFDIVTGNPDAVPPGVPAVMTGLTSFALVPEPSTFALLALGAGALFLRRRK
jgi:hypothetical protein